MKAIKKTYDLALQGGTFISLDEGKIIHDGLVLIKSGYIEFFGEKEKAPEYSAIKTINSAGKHILPGFFNQHTHLSISLYRGLGTDLRLQDWLEKAMWPLEKAFSNPENVYLGSLLSLVEMIKNGTSCLANMDFHSLAIGKAVEEAGIRALLGEGLFDGPTPSASSPQETFDYTRELNSKYADNDLISSYLAPHAPFSCSPELYSKTALVADELGIPIGSHVSETRHEIDLIKKKFGVSPVKLLERTGAFNNQFIAYHVVHPDESDIEILASNGVSVVHNPHSNMVLGSGFCPVKKLKEKEIKVGIGTDSAGSNNHLSMIRELQTAYLIHKGLNQDAAFLKAKETVEMATTVGYDIYGLEKLGKIKSGYKADILIIDLNSIHNQPISDLYSALASSVHPRDVKTLVVNGKVIMEDRKILTIDEELIKQEARKFGLKMKIEFPNIFNRQGKEAGNE